MRQIDVDPSAILLEPVGRNTAPAVAVAALEATPKIWDLAAAWLVLSELGCPIRWLQNHPDALAQGEDLTNTDFPVLVADRNETLNLFLPWAEALLR
jgi:myo-inositol-1(or 4)-monophosphatase